MNAKTEFLEHIKDKPRVVCAEIKDINYARRIKEKWTLYEGYTDKEYGAFLENISFTYDDGYGSQEVGGTIWYEDGTYSNRAEYDGSEWWDYHKVPKKPTKPEEN